jgi:hypothetical protein
MSNEFSDLDFTSTIVKHARDLPIPDIDPITKVLKQVESLIDTLELKVELGSHDQRLWRLLAGLYLAGERTSDYNDLICKYQAAFGQPLKLLAQSAAVIALPIKVNKESVPVVAEVKALAELPAGVVVDFSEVRRASTGGIVALTGFLAAFHDSSVSPQLRGAEPFMASVERAAIGDTGSRELWELLLAYRKFLRDDKGHQDLLARFGARFGQAA